MTLTFVATDIAFLAAVGMCGGYFWSIRGDAVMRQRWRSVVESRSGGGAAVILTVYVLIAGLDSIHIAVGGETTSVLDRMLTPLRVQVETTYSAPFAGHSYAREAVPDATGRITQRYPRLRYGARHLTNPQEDTWPDVMTRGSIGALTGLAVVFAVMFCVNAARRRRFAGTFAQFREQPWSAHWKMLALLGAVIGGLCALAPHYHVLGTDKVGNDVMYLTLKSVRSGLVLGVLSSLIALPIAVALGIAAGYFGGWIDDVVQYLYTTLSSIPGVLLIAAAALSFDLLLQQYADAFTSLAVRADMKLLALCLVLGLTGWTSLCRLLRAEVMKLRAIEFVAAARALGTTSWRILRQHLVPNTFHLVIITTVIDFSGLILAEAVLTYIDIGVDPSMESWGNMINGARLELAREPIVWWSLVAAFAGMFGLVLAANLFADAVRDAFDPRVGRALATATREASNVTA